MVLRGEGEKVKGIPKMRSLLSESDDNDDDDSAALAKNNTAQEGKEVKHLLKTHSQPITTSPPSRPFTPSIS